jgi:hypothetical protein
LMRTAIRAGRRTSFADPVWQSSAIAITTRTVRFKNRAGISLGGSMEYM